MRPLPDRIKVAHAEYTVIEMDGKRNRLSRIGECDHTAYEIRIDTTMQPTAQCDTVIHEILHAITYLYNVRHHEKYDDEYVVSTISTALTTVLVDNPPLLDWITAMIQA